MASVQTPHQFLAPIGTTQFGSSNHSVCQIIPNPFGAFGTAKSLGCRLCTWALSHGKPSAADEETRGALASLRQMFERLKLCRRDSLHLAQTFSTLTDAADAEKKHS